jgi:hypothetical protein
MTLKSEIFHKYFKLLRRNLKLKEQNPDFQPKLHSFSQIHDLVRKELGEQERRASENINQPTEASKTNKYSVPTQKASGNEKP